jgi:hypothetical protein
VTVACLAVIAGCPQRHPVPGASTTARTEPTDTSTNRGIEARRDGVDAMPSSAESNCPDSAVGSVTLIDSTHCRVPRSVFFGHPGCPTNSPRPEQVFGDGSPTGVRFTSSRPTSVFAICGVRPDDIWISINGTSLTSPDRALDAYVALRRASSVRLEGLRDGRPITVLIDLE